MSRVQFQVLTATTNQNERKHSISVLYGVPRNGALLLRLHGIFIMKLTQIFPKNRNYSHKMHKNINLFEL